MLPAFLLLAALQQAPAPAVICPAVLPALAPPWTGWTTRTSLTAADKPADLSAAMLTQGFRTDVTLTAASGVTFAMPLARPAPAGSTGGTVALTVAAAGKYRLSLGGAIWADMVGPGGKAVTSIAHGHGPACSGIRKYVDFPLQPGRYVLQLSEGKAPMVAVMLTSAP